MTFEGLLGPYELLVKMDVFYRLFQRFVTVGFYVRNLFLDGAGVLKQQKLFRVDGCEICLDLDCL